MLKKILIGFLILIVLLIAAAIVIPILYKDKIISKAKEGINKSVNAKVNFGDAELTIISASAAPSWATK
jgi:hypothetical protein